MARVVLKYEVGAARVPARHRFLHAGVQNDRYFMWLEVENDSEFMDSPYTIIPTGYSEVPPGAVHKATIVNDANGVVWHIYDKRTAPVFANKGDSEASFIEENAENCFACGGSGHAKDAEQHRKNSATLNNILWRMLIEMKMVNSAQDRFHGDPEAIAKAYFERAQP